MQHSDTITPHPSTLLPIADVATLPVASEQANLPNNYSSFVTPLSDESEEIDATGSVDE